MKKMTHTDARYAQRKLRELLRLVAQHIRHEAGELLSQSQLMEEEARNMLEVCNVLER